MQFFVASFAVLRWALFFLLLFFYFIWITPLPTPPPMSVTDSFTVKKKKDKVCFKKLKNNKTCARCTDDDGGLPPIIAGHLHLSSLPPPPPQKKIIKQYRDRFAMQPSVVQHRLSHSIDQSSAKWNVCGKLHTHIGTTAAAAKTKPNFCPILPLPIRWWW